MAKIWGKEGADRRTIVFKCGCGESGASVWVQDVGSDPMVGEIPQGVSTPGGVADGRLGPQTSMGSDMGVYTPWGVPNNGGTVGNQGVYFPPPEHGCKIHCDLSYHGLVSVGRAEARNAPIQVMVGSARLGYPVDKGGACRSIVGG